jgi:hypothetical protein
MSVIDAVRRRDDGVTDTSAAAGAVAAATSQDAAKGIITPQTEQRAIEGFRMAVTGGRPTTAFDTVRADAVAADLRAAMNRADLPPGVRAQVAKALVRLGNGIVDGTIEPRINNAFLDHLHSLASKPFDPKPAAGKVTGSSDTGYKGALAQMTRASQVLDQVELARGTKLAYDPGAGQTGIRRAGLPILDKQNIDADPYFKTRDGVLHVESTNTLADKLKSDRTGGINQTQRQAQWVNEAPTGQPRQIGYFVLDKGTALSALMDDRNLKQLGQVIPKSDQSVRNIIIGDRKYSLDDLNSLNKDAQAAADKHVDALRRSASDPSTFDAGKAYREFAKNIASTPDQAMRVLDKKYGEPQPAATPSLKQGTVWGAAAGATVSVIQLASDGKLNLQSAGQVAAGTAQGAAVGAVTTKLEQGITPLIDRAIGKSVQQKATQMAASALTQGGAESTGLAARTLVSRMAGSTVAGAVVTTAISAWQNRDGLAHGDSKAIGNVVADTAVGAGSVLAATAAGAAMAVWCRLRGLRSARLQALWSAWAWHTAHRSPECGTRSRVAFLMRSTS